MKILEKTSLSLKEKQQLWRLWNKEFPTVIRFKDLSDLEHYLTDLKNTVFTLAISDTDRMIGWIIDFDRDGEHWLAMLVSSEVQGLGIGTLLLDQVKERNTELNAWVVDHDFYVKSNKQVYRSPLKFYLKKGFRIVPDVRLELDHLSAAKTRWNK